jgi:large subunit ribosomal protein L16
MAQAGRPDHWVAVVKPGRILFGWRASRTRGTEAMRLASHKLPVATKLVAREGAVEGGER